ncbi:MAG TPA: CBS domain-containing protein, partial [Acidobacteriota bacterium]
GGTMRSPFTAMMFTLELTHDLNVLPGLLIGCVASHAVTVLMLRRSILTEKVARRGYHVMREYSVDPLMMIRVKEVMDQTAPTVLASMKVSELSDRIAKADDPVLMQHQALWIVDDQNQLKGIITRGDILRFLQKNGSEDSTLLEAGNTKLIVAHPDELVYDAANKMLKNDIGRLPVVSKDNPRQLIGYLGRHGIMQARLKMINEEHQREPGWLSRFSNDDPDDARFGI